MTWFSVLFLVCRYYCLKNCCIFCLQRQSQSVALASREDNFVSGNIGPSYKSAFCPIPSLAFTFVLKINLIFDLMDEKNQFRSYSLGGMWLLKIENCVSL